MTIGATFALSLVAGPLLDQRDRRARHLRAHRRAGAAGDRRRAAAWCPIRRRRPRHAAEGDLGARGAAPTAELLRLNYGIFALHAVADGAVRRGPFALRDAGLAAPRPLEGLPAGAAGSVVLMLPAIDLSADRAGPRQAGLRRRGRAAARRRRRCWRSRARRSALIVAALLVFFTAFNLLEAKLPSMVSEHAPPRRRAPRAASTRACSSSASSPAARVGGWLSQHHGPAAVFGFCLALTALWLVAGATMSAAPAYNRADLSMGET